MSKLTFYEQRFPNQNDYDFLTVAVAAGITSIKIEGQLEAVEMAHSLNPNLFIGYRNIGVLEGDDSGGFKQDWKPGQCDAIKAAAAHLVLLKQHMGERAKYAYICSPYNEIDVSTPAIRVWYNAFEEERQRLYAGIGRHALILCVGVKANIHDKPEFMGCIKLAYENDNAVDLHAYNSKRLYDDGPFLNDISEGLMPHRLLYNACKAWGIGVPRFFFGEGGHDAIASSYKSGPGYNGFRDIGLSNADVVADWSWWEDQFIKWTQVLFIRVPSGPAHPADKLLIGVATFIFSDAQIIQPDYNTKWAGGNRGQDPGVAYQWLDYIKAHNGDPVPATGSPTVPTPTTPPPPSKLHAGTGTIADGPRNVRSAPTTTGSVKIYDQYATGKTITVIDVVAGSDGYDWAHITIDAYIRGDGITQ